MTKTQIKENKRSLNTALLGNDFKVLWDKAWDAVCAMKSDEDVTPDKVAIITEWCEAITNNDTFTKMIIFSDVMNVLYVNDGRTRGIEPENDISRIKRHIKDLLFALQIKSERSVWLYFKIVSHGLSGFLEKVNSRSMKNLMNTLMAGYEAAVALSKIAK